MKDPVPTERGSESVGVQNIKISVDPPSAPTDSRRNYRNLLVTVGYVALAVGLTVTLAVGIFCLCRGSPVLDENGTIKLGFKSGSMGVYQRNAKVTRVEENSQGEQLGVQVGWRIVEINGGSNVTGIGDGQRTERCAELYTKAMEDDYEVTFTTAAAPTTSARRKRRKHHKSKRRAHRRARRPPSIQVKYQKETGTVVVSGAGDERINGTYERTSEDIFDKGEQSGILKVRENEWILTCHEWDPMPVLNYSNTGETPDQWENEPWVEKQID